MTTRPLYLFFFVDALTGKTFYLKPDGTIGLSDTPVQLKNSPAKWQEIAIAWDRDLEKIGIVRNFTTNLDFPFDGRAILKQLFDDGFHERQVYFVVKKYKFRRSSPSTFSDRYEHYFVGECDLSSIRMKDDGKATVSIKESSIHKKLAARENTDYEFKMYQSQTGEVVQDQYIIVKFDGVEIQENLHYTLTDVGDITMTSYTLPLGFVSREGAGLGIKTSSQFAEQITSNPGYYQNPLNQNYLFKTAKQQTVNLKARLKWKCNGNPIGGAIRIDLFTNFSAPSFLANIYPLTTMVNGQTYDVTINTNVVIAAGATVFLRVGQTAPSGDPSLFKIQWLDDGFADFGFVTRIDPREIRCYLPDVLMGYMSEKIFGNLTTIQSQALLYNRWIALASGESIRGIEKPKMKTNFGNFYKSMNGLLCLGQSIEMYNGSPRVFIKNRADYFDASAPIYLGEAKEVEGFFAADLIPNSLAFGYPTKDYEDVNGRYEWNNTTKFDTDVISQVRELNATIPYRGDSYGVMREIMEFEGATTTNSEGDNDVFVLSINPIPDSDGKYTLAREVYDSITGIPFPATAFNIKNMTPMRLVDKWTPYLNSVLWGIRGSLIRFATTNKNSELRTQKGLQVFDENADFYLNQPGQNQLFKPYYLEGKCRMPDNLFELLEANPNRCFSFKWKNTIFKGFLVRTGFEPSTREEQSFKLLSTIDNDISKL